MLLSIIIGIAATVATGVGAAVSALFGDDEKRREAARREERGKLKSRVSQLERGTAKEKSRLDKQVADLNSKIRAVDEHLKVAPVDDQWQAKVAELQAMRQALSRLSVDRNRLSGPLHEIAQAKQRLRSRELANPGLWVRRLLERERLQLTDAWLDGPRGLRTRLTNLEPELRQVETWEDRARRDSDDCAPDFEKFRDRVVRERDELQELVALVEFERRSIVDRIEQLGCEIEAE